MRRFLVGVGVLVAAVAATVVVENDARACGGCFHPPPAPTENPSMVTEHRMILSISPQQTTLYDQIKYTGSPKDFAWVLPINGSAKVGLSADLVFSTLGSMTETSINPPPMNCPPMPESCGQGFGDSNAAPPAAEGAGGSSSGGAAADAGSVTVTHEETVGPYETVQLHSTDPTALNQWLTDHGYLIPDDVKPIVGAYVNEHYDFLALKLVPGAGVNSMRPVRVSTPGGSPVLPLRMVAAGTGATVGITLWVVGDGRYEPQNFPEFAITADDLVWDWHTSSSNFAQLRADRTNASGGKAWETESSVAFSKSQIIRTITYAGYPGYDAGTDYLGVDAGDGGSGEDPSQVRQDDVDTLFAGMNPDGDSVRITRLRSDLAHAALANDLVLQAPADQSELSTVRNVTKEANEPMCPIYQGCQVIGEGPRSQAQAAAAKNTNSESFSCNATRQNPENAALLAVAGLLVVARIRNRRRARK